MFSIFLAVKLSLDFFFLPLLVAPSWSRAGVPARVDGCGGFDN